VNPNSGPGDAPLPGQDYVREVPRLNSFANVRTVGYLAIDYCNKPLAQARAEVDLYAGWRRDHAIDGLYVQGIFIDETHNHVLEARGHYLDDLGQFIKGMDGLAGERLVRQPSLHGVCSFSPLRPPWLTHVKRVKVVHNPGTPPEGDLALFGSPDLVCVCEEPYQRYRDAEVQARLDAYRLEHAQTMFQISGVPSGELTEAVRQLCGRGRYMFATELVENFYESFGASWPSFVVAVKEQSGGGRQEL
jgi:hypothetical protein